MTEDGSAKKMKGSAGIQFQTKMTEATNFHAMKTMKME
jgi:hypothetical protein